MATSARIGWTARRLLIASFALLATGGTVAAQDLGRVARSASGVIVSGSPLATAAGLRMLENGGNAVDAAVAAAFALAVVEPSQSGLGGRTHLLIRTTDGQFAALDGWTEVPAGATTPLAGESDTVLGYATIAVPGTVAALARALEQHGSFSLPTVMAPAIELAERGFPLHESEARRIAAVQNRLRHFPGSRAAFLQPNGPLPPGVRFVQPDLARVLHAVAAGGAVAFYTGWIADSIDADMRRQGGLVRRADLERYQPDVARVVRGSYRGYELVGTYLPASGVSVIEALQILETFDLRGRVGSAEWVSLVAQALEASFEDRRASQGLPAEREGAKLTSKAWARSRAGTIRPDGRLPAGDTAFDPSHTTHLSVIDRQGMVVALTQSLGPNLGSKVVTPGLGFLYAATMGYLDARAPGDRPFSSQAPVIVLRDNRPVYITGGGGGRRILSASVLVLSRLIDQRLRLADALAAPRFHPAGGRLVMEDRVGAAWPAGVRERLAALGFALSSNRDGGYFARLHAIEWDAATGEYVGVADDRWTGAAAGVK